VWYNKALYVREVCFAYRQPKCLIVITWTHELSFLVLIFVLTRVVSANICPWYHFKDSHN